MGEYAAPVIEEAQGAQRELWDYLLHHYHYLGRPKLVGEHLKQLVFIDGQVVACLGWASAHLEDCPAGPPYWLDAGGASARVCTLSPIMCGF